MRDGPWALIAGSAQGLGESFTLLLARQGFNLILADREEEALGKIVREVVRKYDVKVVSLCVDLGERDAWKVCLKAMQDAGCGIQDAGYRMRVAGCGMQDAGYRMRDAGYRMRDAGCGIMIYCAAMSEVKPFFDHSPENLERFIDVNNRTAMLLVHGYASYLRDNNRAGKILLMSSLAGLISPVYVSPYAASKAFLISLAKSLYNEFRPHGIGISVCCAGIINTAKFLESKAHGRIPMADPDRVAAYALKNCGKKAVCIHGFANRLNYFILSRMLPRSLASCFVNRAMRKMYPTFGL